MNPYQKIMRNWTLPDGKSEEQVWAELQMKIKSGTASKGRVVHMNRKPWLAAAASVAVLVAVWLVWPQNETTYVVDAGNTMQMTLPDGSLVTMNSASEIQYHNDWSKERMLHLKGQAYFEVKKGSTFIVNTDYGTVEVQGTSFDVMARPEKFEVKCATGKVTVTHKNNSALLTPGLQCKANGDQLITSGCGIDVAIWRNGVFSFTDEELVYVFKELERQFDVRIELPDMESRLCSISFEKSDLESALQIICTAMQLEYRIAPDGTVVVVEKNS
ncbi:MAG: FecR family protein [Flavobacteriales bacterium]